MKQAPKRYLQSLNSALDVLELLSQEPEGLGVSETARRLDISKATAHGVLSNLESRGYVLREEGRAAYRLGRQLWRLGLVAGEQIELKNLYREYLSELVGITGESAQLSEYSPSGEVLYLDRVVAPNPVQTCVNIGGRAPAHCVATGRALLAFQPPAEIETVLSAPLVAYTPMTITDPQKIREALQAVRSTGVAINPGEYRGEIVGIAVPVRDFRGKVVAAIGVSGPAYRFSVARAETYIDDMLRISAAASRKSGFQEGAGGARRTAA